MSSLSSIQHEQRARGAPPFPLRSLLGGARAVAIVTLAAVAWSAAQSGLFRGDLLNPGGWALVQQFFAAALRPELSPAFLRLTLDAALVTLSYAVCGLALSLVIGFLGGLLSSEVWWVARRSSGKGALRVTGSPWLIARALLAAAEPVELNDRDRAHGRASSTAPARGGRSCARPRSSARSCRACRRCRRPGRRRSR